MKEADKMDLVRAMQENDGNMVFIYNAFSSIDSVSS
jgi:hypothetical protein